MLADLKENVKLGRRVDKEGIFTCISIMSHTHTNTLRHIEARMISFPAR